MMKFNKALGQLPLSAVVDSMKYLDANIIIRIVTNDSPDLAEEAILILSEAKKNSLFLHDVIISEICFVLEFHDYKMSRKDICSALLNIVGLSSISVSEFAKEALELYGSDTKLDYADCFLCIQSKNGDVITFDKHLKKVIDASK